MYALQKQSENEVVMSERYEFLPNCFLKVSISSGYFTAILDGSLPPDTLVLFMLIMPRKS